MIPEDVTTFGPRPKLSQTMSNAENLPERGDHLFEYHLHCISQKELWIVTAVEKRTNSSTTRMMILSGECNPKCNFRSFRLDQQEEKFQVFTIPPMSSRSILGGALHISCFEEGMTVQARLCSGEDFEGIAKELSQKKAVKSSFKGSILRFST